MKRLIVPIIGCLFVSIHLQSTNKAEWNEKMLVLYHDKYLSDSLKIIEIANLTYEYCNYFRLIDEEVLSPYRDLMTPLMRKYDSDDLKVHCYKPFFYQSLELDDMVAFQTKYAGYIENSIDPLTRSQGWLLLARFNLRKAVGLNFLHNALSEVKDAKYKKERAHIYEYVTKYYAGHDHYGDQLKYAHLSVSLAEECDDMWQLISSWKGLGATYYGDPKGNSIDDALAAYQTAKKLFVENFGNDVDVLSYRDEFLYVEIVLTLGSIYQIKQQSGLAVKNLKEALRIADANGLTETQAFCHKELGKLYQAAGDYSQAEGHYLNTERMITEFGPKTVESRHITYEIQLHLADLYQETGDYSKATAYYKAGIENYRLMFDEDIMSQNQQMTAYYEALKQEEDIAGLKTIVELKEKQKYYYWGIALILSLLLLLTYRLYRYKIKAVKQHREQLKEEAELLELDHANADLLAQLKRGESEQLQQKLTVGDELLAHKNSVMADFKRFVAEHAELVKYKGQIESILTQQTRIESNVENIKEGLQDVTLDFYFRLQQQAGSRLTPLDFKYCRLIYLNTPTREMAEQLFVDPKTVRVKKSRLKQKFRLGREDDLYSFIRQIISVVAVALLFFGDARAHAAPAPDYQACLDTAGRCAGEEQFEAAARFYQEGLQAYQDHYRNRLDSLNHELKVIYETDKKEQEYARLNQLLSLRKTESVLLTVLIIILIITLILVFFMQKYRLQIARQQRRQKENETTLLRLDKEKKEIEARFNTLESEGYKVELLAEALLVEYNNKVMDGLRLFFTKHPGLKKFKREFEKVMREKNEKIQADIDFQTGLESIHPAFHARLQQQANNKLTALDLKYCRMIYLRMTSKVMADILNVDPKTIRVTKHRLKQKLNLCKTDNLDVFIESMG